MFASLGVFLAANLARAENRSWLFVEDTFSYSDGPLADGVASPWKKIESSPPVRVENGAAFIGPADGKEGYLTRKFAALGLDTPEARAVEARFQLRLSALQDCLDKGSAGVVLQFTGADGKQRRGRLMFRTMADGIYQLGVGSKGSAGVNWSGTAFTPGTDYRIVLVYDGSKGRTRFWIESDPPGVLGPPLAEAVNPDVITPLRVSVQVSSDMGPHRIRIDDLMVQPFGEVR